ncbi:MAG: twin-arginine translocation signal domain-containing protein [Pseudanabaena sp. SU_2_4]|nr:twin-arginine translocation signal domain-containing protein [Pseudanabaena sp. SU_2_4]
MSQKMLRLSRRGFLVGASAIATAGTINLLGAQPWFGDRADAANRNSDVMPFFGRHQAGIITPDVAAALVVALDVTAQSRTELTKLFQTLTQRIEYLMSGGTLAPLDPKYPPAVLASWGIGSQRIT